MLDRRLQRALEGGYFGIQIAKSEYAFPDSRDPDDYVHESVGHVCIFTTSGAVSMKLGTFSVTQVDVDGAHVHGLSTFDVLDLSASTFVYYDLYDGRYSFKASVLKVLGVEDEYVSCNLLILDRLELLPEFRGRGFGLEAIRCLVQRFRIGTGIVAMKPFPLQYESGRGHEAEAKTARGLDKYQGSQAACTRRLTKHYAQLGFVKIPRTDLMCLELVRAAKWRAAANDPGFGVLKSGS